MADQEPPKPQGKRTIVRRGTKASLRGGPLRKKSFGLSKDETLLKGHRQRRALEERKNDQTLKASHRNACLFVVIGVIVHAIVLGGQFNMLYDRGFAGRFAMAIQLSALVVAILGLLAFFARSKRPWVPVLIGTILYAVYIPLAWLVDQQTGTFALLLQGVAMLAFLRGLASAYAHRKRHRQLFSIDTEAPPAPKTSA